MQVGDIIYCKKDYDCEYNDDFFCKKGDSVSISQLQFGDGKILESYIIKNSDEEETVLYIKNIDYVPEISYLWKYFITIKSRGDRIRKVAKEFVK